MRPLFRRRDYSNLEIARQVVSRAEKEALERAEKFVLEAEELFHVADQRALHAERKAREEVLSAVKEDLQRARIQSEQMLKRARSEAEELINTAIVSIEQNTAYTEQVREQQEKELAVAQQMRIDAETELDLARQTREQAAQCLVEARTGASDMATEVEERCHRLVMAAREAAEAEYIAARQELARDIASMRDAMATTWSTLEGFLSASNVTTPVDAPQHDLSVEYQPVDPSIDIVTAFESPEPPVVEDTPAEVASLMDIDVELRMPMTAA